jgi:hypothetical protein
MAVAVADDACFASKYMPDGQHRLLVKKALDLLSKDTGPAIPSTVTIDDLPWPIKLTIEPNKGRKPLWSTHKRHASMPHIDREKLSPFIFMDRDLPLPMTKSLTIEIVGSNSHPSIIDIYPGSVVPSLPWQIDHEENLLDYMISVTFWQEHSFLYDISCVATKLHDNAPSWHTSDLSLLTPLPL